jgi:5-formyltetrahydrofolate cyclo-ligase
MAAPHGSPSLDDTKRALRQRMIAARAELDPVVAGLALGANLLRLRPPPSSAIVSGFWPLGAEIDLRPLLFALHLRGHRIALPVTPPRGHPLTFRAWQPGDALEREKFGTMRPTGEVLVPDVMLVPLLAFDRAGRRLGYGAGYYDRTLAGLPGAIAIGCAFHQQEVDVVPAGPYDMPLHAVVTDAGMIETGEG